MIKNYMEILVEQYLMEMLKSGPEYRDICRCEQCMDDMRAFALNNLKPFYVTCVKGEVFGKYQALDIQCRADIIKQVVKAIEQVSKNKRE